FTFGGTDVLEVGGELIEGPLQPGDLFGGGTSLRQRRGVFLDLLVSGGDRASLGAFGGGGTSLAQGHHGALGLGTAGGGGIGRGLCPTLLLRRNQPLGAGQGGGGVLEGTTDGARITVDQPLRQLRSHLRDPTFTQLQSVFSSVLCGVHGSASVFLGGGELRGQPFTFPGGLPALPRHGQCGLGGLHPARLFTDLVQFIRQTFHTCRQRGELFTHPGQFVGPFLQVLVEPTHG